MSTNILEVDPRSLNRNSWNPNELSRKNYIELVDELRRTKINHKPVICTKEEDGGLLIVDGEWTATAAIEANLALVRVDVRELTPFESRRLTYQANRHGENNPLKEGRLLKEMLEIQEREGEPISIRELAKCMSPMTETFIRNKLIYAELADKAREDPSLPNEHDIARLSVRKVKELLGRGPVKAESEENGAETIAGPGGDSGDDVAPSQLEGSLLLKDGGEIVELTDFKAKFSRWPVERRRAFVEWAAKQLN